LPQEATCFNEKMPTPRGRIENLELEDLERLRVVLRATFLNLRPERLLHQEAHERMGRVIGAARFPSQADSQVEPVGGNLLDPEDLRLLTSPVRLLTIIGVGILVFGVVVLGRLLVDGTDGSVLLTL